MTDLDAIIKNLRTPRFFGIAIFDLVGSMIATEFITNKLEYPRGTGIILALPIGIVVHKTLGIKTALTPNV